MKKLLKNLWHFQEFMEEKLKKKNLLVQFFQKNYITCFQIVV